MYSLRMKGPVPITWVILYSASCSLRKVGENIITLQNPARLLTAVQSHLPSTKSNLMVYSSTATHSLTFFMLGHMTLLIPLSMLYLAASALKGVPSVKLMPWRSFRVSDEWSAAGRISSASQGERLLFLSMMTSGSPPGEEKAASLGAAVPVGSPMLLMLTPACNWRRRPSLPPSGLARAPILASRASMGGVVVATVVGDVVFGGVVVASSFLQPTRSRLIIKIIARVRNIILFISSFHS